MWRSCSRKNWEDKVGDGCIEDSSENFIDPPGDSHEQYFLWREDSCESDRHEYCGIDCLWDDIRKSRCDKEICTYFFRSEEDDDIDILRYEKCKEGSDTHAPREREDRIVCISYAIVGGRWPGKRLSEEIAKSEEYQREKPCEDESLRHILSVDLPNDIRRDEDDREEKYGNRQMCPKEKWHRLHAEKIGCEECRDVDGEREK